MKNKRRSGSEDQTQFYHLEAGVGVGGECWTSHLDAKFHSLTCKLGEMFPLLYSTSKFMK